MKRKKVQVYLMITTIRRIKAVAQKVGTSAGGWVRQTVLKALDEFENKN